MPACSVEELISLLCESLDGDDRSGELRRRILEGVEFADLDINSLDVVDFSLRIQDRFGVEVPGDAFASFVSFVDIATYIQQRG